MLNLRLHWRQSDSQESIGRQFHLILPPTHTQFAGHCRCVLGSVLVERHMQDSQRVAGLCVRLRARCGFSHWRRAERPSVDKMKTILCRETISLHIFSIYSIFLYISLVHCSILVNVSLAHLPSTGLSLSVSSSEPVRRGRLWVVCLPTVTKKPSKSSLEIDTSQSVFLYARMIIGSSAGRWMSQDKLRFICVWHIYKMIPFPYRL